MWVVGVLQTRGDRRVVRLRERRGSRSLLVAAPPGVALPPGRSLVAVTGTFHRLDEATAAAERPPDPVADNAPIIRARRIRRVAPAVADS